MKILALRHVPHEHLGTLADILQESGIGAEYVNFYEGENPAVSLEGADGLVILGGPMNVYETQKYPFLETEDGIIKEALRRSLPTLGICLGAQLIAKSLGARVTQNAEKEIGWYPLHVSEGGGGDKLFRHFEREETVFQWHGDTFEIPDGAELLASSDLCRNQAFRFGDRVYALQFHIEVTPQMIREWLEVSENREEISRLEAKIDPERILAETPKLIGRLNRVAEDVFREFCRLIKISSKGA